MIQNESVVVQVMEDNGREKIRSYDQIDKLFRTDYFKPLCSAINLCVEEVVY